MPVKDAMTASTAGCINPSLELKQEAELGHFRVCESRRWRERRREYDVKLIYPDASAATFMSYRDGLNSYSSCRLFKVRVRSERLGFITLLIYLLFTILEL